MKTGIYTIVFGLIFLCCTSGIKEKPDNDLAKMNLNGKVKSVKETSYTATTQSGSVIKGIRKRETSAQSDFYAIFNSSGRYMEYTGYNPDGSILYRTVYEYGSDGRLNIFRTFKPDGRLAYRYVLKYDAGMNRVAEDSFNAQGGREFSSQFRFNEKGKVTEHTCFMPDRSIAFKQYYSYDTTGNLTEMTSRYSGGEFSNRYTFTYNKEGDKIGQCAWYESGKPASIIVYENGNQVSEKTMTQDGKVLFEKTFKYEYDGKKNWVRMITCKNDVPEYVMEREIEYYE